MKAAPKAKKVKEAKKAKEEKKEEPQADDQEAVAENGEAKSEEVMPFLFVFTESFEVATSKFKKIYVLKNKLYFSLFQAAAEEDKKEEDADKEEKAAE